MANPYDGLRAANARPFAQTRSANPVTPEEEDGLAQLRQQQQNQFSAGLRRAVNNAVSSSQAFVGATAEPFAPNFAARQFQSAEETSRNLPPHLQPQVESFRDVDSPSSAAAYASGALGEGMASVGTMIAASLASRFGLGLAARAAGRTASAGALNAAQFGGGMAAMFPQEAGETALTLRQNPEAMANTTPLERTALAYGKGTVASALESLVPNLLVTRALTGQAGRIAAGPAAAAANIGRKTAAGVVGEGATEGAQEFSGQVAENVAAPSTGYNLERVMEAAVRGAITGGALGAGGGTIQAVRSNIDAASERAREATGAQDGVLNAVVDRLDQIVRRPEEVGASAADTTLGALADAAEQAGALGERIAENAAPAAARTMDAVAALRQRLDRGILRQLTPENRRKYAELTQNFRLLQPAEYDILRNALETGDAETINEAVGTASRFFADRVPRETLQGIKNVADWARKLGAGVTNAARERRASVAGYSREQVVGFRDFLRRAAPQVLDTVVFGQSDMPANEVLRSLMYARDNMRRNPENFAQVVEGVKQATGVDLATVFEEYTSRSGRIDQELREEGLTSTGDSQMARMTERAETFMTDQVREAVEAAGLEMGPGVTYAPDDAVYDENGNVMDPEDTRTTPFTSLGLLRDVLSPERLGRGVYNREDDPRYNIPVEFEPADDRITPEQLARLLGSKDFANGATTLRDATPEELAERLRDGRVRSYISPVGLAAATGREEATGGYKEAFARFVPDFENDRSRAGSVQAQRMLSALSVLNSEGVELAPDQIPQSMWEELGITADSAPIKIRARVAVNSLAPSTVVQRRGAGETARETTLGDLLGITREKRSLEAQAGLLGELAGEENPVAQLNQIKETSRDGQEVTADAILRGLRRFWRENRLSPNAAVPGYLQQLETRVADTARRQRFVQARRALKAAYREEQLTEEQAEEVRALFSGELVPETAEERQRADALRDLANYLNTDLNVPWRTDAELVEMLDDFLDQGIWQADQAIEERYDSLSGVLEAEDTPNQQQEAFQKSPEGQETSRRKGGIDTQNDAEVRRTTPMTVEHKTRMLKALPPALRAAFYKQVGASPRAPDSYQMSLLGEGPLDFNGQRFRNLEHAWVVYGRPDADNLDALPVLDQQVYENDIVRQRARAGDQQREQELRQGIQPAGRDMMREQARRAADPATGTRAPLGTRASPYPIFNAEGKVRRFLPGESRELINRVRAVDSIEALDTLQAEVERSTRADEREGAQRVFAWRRKQLADGTNAPSVPQEAGGTNAPSAQAPARIIRRQQRILRADLRANPNTIYLFGDNLEQRGLGGQAREMRGEPNAIGVPTKKLPAIGGNAFMSDTDYAANIRAIDAALAKIPPGADVVIPAAGLGTGLAKLQQKAPRTFAYLQNALASLETGQPASARSAAASPEAAIQAAASPREIQDIMRKLPVEERQRLYATANARIAALAQQAQGKPALSPEDLSSEQEWEAVLTELVAEEGRQSDRRALIDRIQNTQRVSELESFVAGLPENVRNRPVVDFFAKNQRARLVYEARQRFDERLRNGEYDFAQGQAQVDQWTQRYLKNTPKVRVFRADPTDEDWQLFVNETLKYNADTLNGFAGGRQHGQQLLDEDVPIIFVRRQASAVGAFRQLETLAHEFGHVIQFETVNNDPETFKFLSDAYIESLSESPLNAMATSRVFSPNPGALETAMQVANASQEFTDRLESFEERAEDRVLEKYAAGDEWAKYALSFDEWFAEQFARYAMNSPSVFDDAPTGVRAVLDRLMKELRAFFANVVKRYQPNATFVEYVEGLAAGYPRAPAAPQTAGDVAFSVQASQDPNGEQSLPNQEGDVSRETRQTVSPTDEEIAASLMTIDQERRARNRVAEMDNAIQMAEEDAAAERQEPPQEPPQPPQEPPQPPPPPPDNEARERFVATVQRMLGNRVKVEFDVNDLPEGVNAEYTNELGLDLAKTGEELKKVGDLRRADLRILKDKRAGRERKGQEDPRTIAQLEDSVRQYEQMEEQYRNDLAVRGTIRVAAGMEAQAGLAEHEALHAAFDVFFGDQRAEERRVVTTAVTQGIVGRRLRSYFRDNPAVLNVIDPSSPNFKAEEAAAYAFQLYIHEPEALQLGQRLEGVFNKLLQYLQRLVGYKTYEQRAKTVFDDLAAGRRSERGVSVLRDRVSVDQSMSERSQAFARSVGGSFMKIYDTVLASSYRRLADSGNPALAQIARLGFNETGAEGQGMIQRQRNMTTLFSNRLKEALHAMTEEELNELHRNMLLGEEPGSRRGKEAQQALRRILDEARDYQREAGIDIGFLENYYPMIWSPEKVAADYNGFVKMLSQPKYADKVRELNKTPGAIADDIVAYLDRGHEFQAVFDDNGEPVADSSRRRSLAFIDPQDRLAFMEDGLVETMAHYLNQSVRHAEYVRAYGDRGGQLTKLMNEARGVYGATKDDMALAQDYVDGLMGNKEVGMSRELKDLYGAMVTYQNVRLLPLSVFSSLVDPLGIAIRTNSMGAAFDAFTYSIRNIFTDFRREWTPDRWEQFAEDLGTIDMSGTVKSIDKIYTGVTLRGKTRAINDAFFKYNLLNGWVKNNHIAATKAAQLFLRRSAEGMIHGDQRDAENLQEVGVRPEDIVYDEQLGRIRATVPEILGIEADQLAAYEQDNPDTVAAAREQARRIREAIHKMVRESLIQPSSADMPNWMSNPYWAPIAHLKTFVFGFNATILRRLMYEAQRGNYSPMYYAAAYVPGMIAADFIKGLAGNGGEEPEWKKDWELGDYLEHGVYRSGLLGTGQFFVDVGNDVNRGGGGWESLAGPSLEQARDLIKAMNAKTSEPAERWMLDAMPANALYDQWVMP